MRIAHETRALMRRRNTSLPANANAQMQEIRP
jgi:hypothetical protein